MHLKVGLQKFLVRWRVKFWLTILEVRKEMVLLKTTVAMLVQRMGVPMLLDPSKILDKVQG